MQVLYIAVTYVCLIDEEQEIQETMATEDLDLSQFDGEGNEQNLSIHLIISNIKYVFSSF